MADRHTGPRDRGSVLLLFPAAFMIVLVLGALAIDAGVVFLHQRDLAAAAGAAANDAATLALDADLLRVDGVVWLDPVRVNEEITASLGRRGVLERLVEPPQVLVQDGRIELSLASYANHVIAPALAGAADGRVVRVTVRVDAVIDDR